MRNRLFFLFAFTVIWSAALATTTIQAQDNPQQGTEEAQAAPADQERAAQPQVQKKKSDRGRPRRDLKRFVGLYGDPMGSHKGRRLFVTVSCNGYLVVGPMWVEVSPWWMRSAADTEFTYADSFISFSLEFTMREDGEVESLAHDLKSLASPLQRVGPLPDELEGCVNRSWP